MVADNPFYVLGVSPRASAHEIERQGQKLLAMLEVGLEAASVYPTPLGGMPRDADLVRRSLDELRDPGRRALHEVWATLDPSVEAALDREGPSEQRDFRWTEAFAAFGWRVQ